jgi:hypothetical protein
MQRNELLHIKRIPGFGCAGIATFGHTGMSAPDLKMVQSRFAKGVGGCQVAEFATFAR